MKVAELKLLLDQTPETLEKFKNVLQHIDDDLPVAERLISEILKSVKD